MKTIILLEHKTPKEFILQKAKERGYRVLMVANAPNEMFSKYLSKEDVLITDVFDLLKVTEDVLFFVKKKNIKIDAIGTFTDDLVIACADIANLINCKNIGFLGSRFSSSNKLAMRVRLEEKGVKQPKFSVFNAFEEKDKKILETFQKPCVIKPIFGTCSYGVKKIDDEKINYTEIKEFLRDNVSTKKREAFRRFDGNMLIEEYIEGKMISLDGFINDREVLVVGSLEFIMGREPYFTQVASYIPARLSSKEFSTTKTYLKQVIKALDFQYTPFHAEFRIREGEPYLIEIAGRMAGATIHDTYNQVYEIDMIGDMLDCWLGKLKSKEYSPKGINYHELYYPKIDHSGILKKLTGLEELKNLENIWYLNKISSIGDKIKTYPHIPTPLFEYSIFCKSKNDLDKIKEKINKVIKYEIF